MNWQIETRGAGQAGPVHGQNPERADVPSIPKAGIGAGTEVSPWKRVVACPFCGTEIDVVRAGLCWCAGCQQAIAVDDAGQPWVGLALTESSLAALVCAEEDLAVFFDPDRDWHPGGDAGLRADFGIDESFRPNSGLLAQIEEDIASFA